MVHHKGGCHCGTVSFVVDTPANIEVIECNCSICKMKGFLHLQVTKDRINITGMDNLSTYTFGTHTAQHYFCKTCGICSFYIPRSFPQGYSVNVNCLDTSTFESIKIIKFDGQSSYEEGVNSLPVVQ